MMSTSGVIDVVIEERMDLSRIEELPRRVVDPTSQNEDFLSSKRVFRDYILSSEPFRLENYLN